MCFWWAQMESNHRPHAYQACALTIWAMSPYCRVCQLHSFVWAYLVLLMYSAISCTFDIDYYFSISQSTLKNKQWIHLDLFLLRKEVIQPHLPIRLPCYDFTPIIRPTFGRALLAVRLRTSGVPNSHGVTGGVYKARERIHGSMLTCHY